MGSFLDKLVSDQTRRGGRQPSRWDFLAFGESDFTA
tara:strand:- start:1019 stop:1126 length:108 start_codon:yes stop_codon:yes gene_type:complete